MCVYFKDDECSIFHLESVLVFILSMFYRDSWLLNDLAVPTH